MASSAKEERQKQYSIRQLQKKSSKKMKISAIALEARKNGAKTPGANEEAFRAFFATPYVR